MNSQPLCSPEGHERRWRARSDRCSQRLQKLIDRRPFTPLRAVHVTAPPCSDRYAADWRGPQTQRRYSHSSPQQEVYGNFLMFLELRREISNRSTHSERLRVTRTQCECASSPDLGILSQVQKFSRDADWRFRVRADHQLDLALAGCGSRCVTTIS